MLRRVEKISLLEKQALKHRAANVPGADTSLRKITFFHRFLRDDILKSQQTYLIECFHKHGRRYLDILEIIASALLSTVYQTGNCGEQARFIYWALLKAGINKSIELAYMQDSINSSSDHYAIVVDRSGDITDMPKWRGAIYIDAWPPSEKLIECKSEDSISLKKMLTTNRTLTPFLMNPETCKLSSDARLEKNLDQAEWESIKKYLSKIKQCVTKEMLSKALKKFNINESAATHVERIKKQIDIEIATCDALIKNPPTRPLSFLIQSFLVQHWKKPPVYSNTAFNEKKHYR